MSKLATNGRYMAGKSDASAIVRFMDASLYESIEEAIDVKTALIANFEDEIGFTREMDNIDSNYAYNLGLLDGLKELADDGEEE